MEVESAAYIISLSSIGIYTFILVIIHVKAVWLINRYYFLIGTHSQSNIIFPITAFRTSQFENIFLSNSGSKKDLSYNKKSSTEDKIHCVSD